MIAVRQNIIVELLKGAFFSVPQSPLLFNVTKSMVTNDNHRQRIQEIAEGIRDGTCQDYVRAIEDLLVELAPAQMALEILKKFNRFQHDTDAYLYEVVQWGLGKRDDKPNQEDYGIS